MGFVRLFTGLLMIASATSAWSSPKYINVSFTGDGITPAATQLFDAQKRSLEGARHSVQSSPSGDAGYGVPIELPPGLNAPSLSLSYSSASGSHSTVGKGWSLSAGPTITRLTGRQEAVAYADVPNAHRLSGGGFDAMLFEDGVWKVVSNDPLTAVVSYDSLDRTFTIESSGKTYTFEPKGPAGFDWEGAGIEPTTWQVTRIDDPSGNRIDFTWDASRSRLEEVTYGHNPSAGVTTPNVKVVLQYADRPNATTSVAAGFVDRIDQHLVGIDVRTHATGLGPLLTQLNYALVYGDIDGEDQLVEVWQTEQGVDPVSCGACDPELAEIPGDPCYSCNYGDARQLATFRYSEILTAQQNTGGPALPYGAPTRPVATPLSVASIGLTQTDGSGYRSESEPIAQLSDFTGDGLADLVRTDPDGWTVFGSGHLLDWTNTAPASVFEAPEARTLESTNNWGAGLGDTRTYFCDEENSVSLAIKRLVDLNGDGFDDLVWNSPVLPTAFETGGVDPWCDGVGTPWEAPLSVTWQVVWGSASGFDTEVGALHSPMQYLRVGKSPRLPEVDRESDDGAMFIDDGYPFDDATVDLMDMTGDGWLDILWIGEYGGLQSVWVFEAETDGSGWALTPRDWATLAPSLRTDMKATASSYGAVDETELYLDPVLVGGVIPVDTGGDGYIVDPRDSKIVIKSMSTISKLVDLNGDGFADFVKAGTSGVWDVYFGSPRGFIAGSWASPAQYITTTDEGGAYVYACSSTNQPYENFGIETAPQMYGATMEEHDFGAFLQVNPPLSCASVGNPSNQIIESDLMDVDADGRPDLVDTFTDEWFRNLGDGFEMVGRALPSELAMGGLSESRTYSNAFNHEERYNNAYGYGQPPADYITPTQSKNVVVRTVTDLDRDGMLDVVQTSNIGNFTAEQNTGAYQAVIDGLEFEVIYGTYGRSGQLIEVEQPTGALTALHYESSSWAWPSGEPNEPHQMAQRKDLLVGIETVDPVTGHAGYTHMTYLDGTCFDGACVGFSTVTTEQFRYDPVLSQAGSYTVIGLQTTNYDLDRDFQVPSHREMYIPQGNPWTATPGMSLRVDEELSYAVSVTSAGAPVQTARSQSRTVTDYADSSGSSRTFTTMIDRDSLGFPIEVEHLYAGDPRQDVTVTTTWVDDAAGTLRAPSEQTTYAYDPVTDGYGVPVERVQFAYDGLPWGSTLDKGLLTEQTASSGRTDLGVDGETLLWTFTRDPDRGQITRIDAPAGSTKVLSGFTFGGAHPQFEELWVASGNQVTETQVDGMGRPVLTIDPNGVVSRTELDAFGRPVRTYTQGVGGGEFLASETFYSDGAVPQVVDTLTYDYATPASTGVFAVDRAWLDGFGDSWQTWTENDAGNWLVSVVDRDITGAVVREHYPQTVDVASTDPWAVASTGIARWVERDGLGIERRTWANYTAQKGRVDRTVPEAGVIRTVDHEDYVTVTTHDTHGRVVQVEEGKTATAKTGAYAYDGRGRLVVFEDALGNQHRYAWDGAGRIRQVWRRAVVDASATPTPTGCPEDDTGIVSTEPCIGLLAPPAGTAWTWEPTHAYAYDGPNPIEMHEGLITDPVVATWAWDELGRNTDHAVMNRGTGALDRVYTWDWDVNPVNPAEVWYGALWRTTDPAGELVNEHGPEAFGSFGRVTTSTRTWNSDPFVASLGYTYDFQGREASVAWPDGVVVDTTWAPGDWKLSSTVLHSGGTAQVDYLYDDFGMPAGFFGTTATGVTHSMDEVRTTPVSLKSRNWSTTNDPLSHTVDYGYYGNLLLQSKVIDNHEPITYHYDVNQRVERVSHYGSDLETFSYDAIGNPTAVTRLGADDWTYATVGARFGEIPSRAGVSGDVDTYLYDGWSRLTNWRTVPNSGPNTYRKLRYDGLARLDRFEEKVQGNPLEVVNYLYTADNELVQEARWVGMTVNRILRHGGIRHETASGETLLEVLPMVRVMDGGTETKWILHDIDGHALAVYDGDGNEDTFEVSGVYGAKLDLIPPLSTPLDYFVGADWKIDGLHASELDRERGIVHRGQRHALLDDGRWLQPEPLLALALKDADPARPGLLTGTYAGGNPVMREDNSGFFAPLLVFAGAGGATLGAGTGAAAVGAGTGAAAAGGGVTAATVLQGAAALGVTAIVTTNAEAIFVPAFEAAITTTLPIVGANLQNTFNEVATSNAQLAEQGENGATEGEATSGAETKPEAGRQKGDRMRDGTAGESEQQLTEIQSAQGKVRQGKSDQIIDSTEKSRQRADHRRSRIRSYEDALEEYEDFDDLPDEHSYD